MEGEASMAAVKIIDSQIMKVKRKLNDIDRLIESKKVGSQLESDQLVKIGTGKARQEELANLERSRREELTRAPLCVREHYGVCTNCGDIRHPTAQCPRPKLAQKRKPQQGQGSAQTDTRHHQSARPQSAAEGRPKGTNDRDLMQGRGFAQAHGDLQRVTRPQSAAEGRPKGALPQDCAHEQVHAQAKSGPQYNERPQLVADRWKDRVSPQNGMSNWQKDYETHTALHSKARQQDHATQYSDRHGEEEAQGRAEGKNLKEHDSLRVLCIAEKPSVASAIAEALSGGRKRIRSGQTAPMCRLFDTYAFFPPARARCSVTVTSVIGHICTLDFDEDAGLDPGFLYGARTKKLVEESSRDNGIEAHIISAAKACDFLYLWLDCDREGENICFEVINVCRDAGLFLDDTNIYRAKFSSLTESAIKEAFARPIRPNPAEAYAVDARQELDLKIGVSFTRLLTRRLLEPAKHTFKDRKLRLISFGPCQSPTLYFTVQRAREIASFVPRRFWEIHALCKGLELCWKTKRTFEQRLAQDAISTCRSAREAVLESVSRVAKRFDPPPGLNTVAMLSAASISLGYSPQRVMQIAEKLYMRGYISYPRTESTRYHESFDIQEVLQQHVKHPMWGGLILGMMQGGFVKAPTSGFDAADHPPITPMKCAARHNLSDSEWALYELVTRAFFGSLLPACRYTESHAILCIGGLERFTYTWHKVRQELSFTDAMPWRLNSLNLMHGDDEPFGGQPGTRYPVTSVKMTDGMTEPPPYMRESELIEMMDANGIGTDASIPTHITNVTERKYVEVVDVCGQPMVTPEGDNEGVHNAHGSRQGLPGDGKRSREGKYEGGLMGRPKGGCIQNKAKSNVRHLKPTALGLALIQGFTCVDEGLVKPDIRSKMEQQVTLIAKGLADKQSVLDMNLALYYAKYRSFEDRLHLFYPFFVSDDMPACVSSSHNSKDTPISSLSEGQLRQREAEEDARSALADALEKQRLEESRAAAIAAFKADSEETAILASLFSIQGGNGERSGVGLGAVLSGGRQHCEVEVARLQRLVAGGQMCDLEARLSAVTVAAQAGAGGRRGRGGRRGHGGERMMGVQERQSHQGNVPTRRGKGGLGIGSQ